MRDDYRMDYDEDRGGHGGKVQRFMQPLEGKGFGKANDDELQ